MSFLSNGFILFFILKRKRKREKVQRIGISMLSPRRRIQLELFECESVDNEHAVSERVRF